MNKLYILSTSLLMILFAGCQQHSSSIEKSIAVIGTYTQEEGHVDGKGEGVLIYSTGPKAEDWKMLSKYSDIINPSFLCLSPVHPIIYAVSEQGPGVAAPGSVIKVIKYDTMSYNMEELQTISAMGDAPCYVSTSNDGEYVFVANYVTGNFVCYGVNDDGTLREGKSYQPEGSGPDARQEGPHAHYIRQHAIDNFIYGVDLGTDKVTRYSLKNDSLVVEGTVPVTPASGPRHMVWTAEGQHTYILNELSGTIELWNWESNARRRGVISLIPEGDERDPGAADIHISEDGKNVYASLRGDFNEIVVLRISPVTKKLDIIQRVPVEGEVPRNFAISPDGKYLAVALQNSDRITLFNRNTETGMLESNGEAVEIKTPVCIAYKYF